MAKSKKLIYLEKILRLMAKMVIKKYKPKIVGITGSVGKTSAKTAVDLVLATKFRVRSNQKNYNNEIGIPLTIIGAESGGKSFVKWMGVFLKWIIIIIFPIKYPEILVLEMGVDRPGDMEYLLSFVPVDVGIITNISGSHLEFFKTLENILDEKGKINKKLPLDGAAILNGDDGKLMAYKNQSSAPVSVFGFSEKAQFKAENISFSEEMSGIYFRLNYNGKSVPVRLKHVLADYLVYAALSAVAAGIHFKINLVDIAAALENFSPLPGRMNLIPAIKKSYAIDDSYNASPTSVLAALKILEKISPKRKIVVLGDMLELGLEEEKGHREVGKKVFEIKADLFFAIGERMESAVKELRSLEYPEEKIFYFDNPEILGRKLQEEIQEGDLILIKGSQGMRMEKIVEEIMAEPQRAEELLCRQNKEWKKLPFSG
jgi:UDP-N-acetylmuramoyl-tripeptide--D-alanyl-D-alanine ligase